MNTPHDMTPEKESTLARASQTFSRTIQSLQSVGEQLNESFVRAASVLENCRGRVIVSGLGKSGLIGRKTAATLTSVGTPALFLHPSEALHGDLGVISDGDVAICVSNSGETEEVIALLPFLRRFGASVIAICRSQTSTLGQLADIVIETGPLSEADPHGLIPTVSTTVQLVIGDALAVELLIRRGVTPDHFAAVHPGGTLGRRAFLRVRDLMTARKATPVVAESASIHDAIKAMSTGGLGCVLLVNETDGLAGLFTDGDLRRCVAGETSMDEPVASVATRQPTCIDADELAATALHMMNERRITVLPVLNGGDFAGLLHVHQLYRSGVV